MQTIQKNLVRKQIMLSSTNVNKLEKIADKKGASVAEIVRLAVDSYNPDISDIGDQELMLLVSEKLQEAIKETDRVSQRVDATIEKLEVK